MERPIYDLAAWILRRQHAPPLVRYPARAGVWPAVAGYLLFAFFELASGQSANPRAVAAAAYTAWTLAAMVVFGRDVWLARGECFSVLFRLVGAFGPVEVRSDDAARATGAERTAGPGRRAASTAASATGTRAAAASRSGRTPSVWRTSSWSAGTWSCSSC